MKIKNNFIKISLLFVMCFTSMQGLAEPAWLKSATDKILNDLSAAKNKGSLNSKTIYNLVQRDIIPHVDMETVSMRVVGPGCWNSADAATKNQFKTQFTKFVIRTYEAPLEGYAGDKIEFTKGSTSRIKSYIVRPNGQKTSLDYQVNGSKIIDLIVEDISMVNSYKAQFDCSNLKQLVEQLKQHNAAQ